MNKPNLLREGWAFPWKQNVGGMAERFNAPVLKTDVVRATGGSNPSSSA